MYSKKVLSELKNLGLKPFPVLQIKEKTMKEPKIPITVIFPINHEVDNEEKVVVVIGNSEKITNVSELPSSDIGKESLSIQLHYCSM